MQVVPRSFVLLLKGSRIFNFLVTVGLKLKISKIKKAFSTLTYDKTLSEYDFDYRVKDFEASINFIEGKE